VVTRSSAPSTTPERLTAIAVAPAGVSSGDTEAFVGVFGAANARTVAGTAIWCGKRSGARSTTAPGLAPGSGGPERPAISIVSCCGATPMTSTAPAVVIAVRSDTLTTVSPGAGSRVPIRLQAGASGAPATMVSTVLPAGYAV